MSENVEAYFVMLEMLSSEAIDRAAQDLAAHEKQDAARFVAHIAEIAARNYHLALGYPSLFQYCIERFNLSEGSVYRRTQVARICRRFPQILAAISRGRLHLTGASLIAPHLTEENVESLIAMAEKTTKRELEKLLVALAPKKAFVPSLRPQAGRDPAGGVPPLVAQEFGAAPAARGAQPDAAAPAVHDAQADAAAPEMAAVPVTAPAVPCVPKGREIFEAATADIYNFRFSAGSEFTAKFMRLAEVLGIAHPQTHIEDVLSRALEIALDEKDPQRALERRRQREAHKQAARPGEGEERSSPCSVAETPPRVKPVLEREAAHPVAACDAPPAKAPAAQPLPRPAVSRHVPAEVRERVLERAGYQCEYRGPGGVRCGCRTGLQVEHTLPFAVYPTHDAKFLRVFCAAHNLHAAREFYGPGFVQQKIDAARAARANRPAPCVVV